MKELMHASTKVWIHKPLTAFVLLARLLNCGCCVFYSVLLQFWVYIYCIGLALQRRAYVLIIQGHHCEVAGVCHQVEVISDGT